MTPNKASQRQRLGSNSSQSGKNYFPTSCPSPEIVIIIHSPWRSFLHQNRPSSASRLTTRRIRLESPRKSIHIPNCIPALSCRPRLLRPRQPLLHPQYPVLTTGMRGRELRWGILLRLFHSLPEGHCCFGVVAASGHHQQAEEIGFGFHLSRAGALKGEVHNQGGELGGGVEETCYCDD